MRSQSRSAVGWILAPALIAALWLPGEASAAVKTGQSPDCERYCVSVRPAEGPEGSVFRFRGHGWRPNRTVWVFFGVYCRPGEACPAIGYEGVLRTDARGHFVFRLRAGEPQQGDRAKRIDSGAWPSFEQRVLTRRGKHRTVTRQPRYRVVVPPG